MAAPLPSKEAKKPVLVHYIDDGGAPKCVKVVVGVAKTLGWLVDKLAAKEGLDDIGALVTLDGRPLNFGTTVGEVVFAQRDLEAPVDIAARRKGMRHATVDAADLGEDSLGARARLCACSLRVPLLVRGGMPHLKTWTAKLRAKLAGSPLATTVSSRDRRRIDSAADRPATFGVAFGEIFPKSSPALSAMIMDEHAMDDYPEDKAALLRSLPLAECRPAWRGGANLFESDAFPEPLRPPALCLVSGGLGASCHLHADHYGWIGWSLLCRGTKTWRFAARTPDRDAAYAASRDPIFADLVPGGIGASFKSPKDLFGRDERLGYDVELEQAEGDLLLFPGDCWHQTRHDARETLSVCAQYVSAATLGTVVDHVRAWREKGPEPRERALLDPRARLSSTLVDCLGDGMASTLYAMALDPSVPDPMTAWRAAYARGDATACATCGETGAKKKCARCKRAFYCSRACQERGWPAHKAECPTSKI